MIFVNAVFTTTIETAGGMNVLNDLVHILVHSWNMALGAPFTCMVRSFASLEKWFHGFHIFCLQTQKIHCLGSGFSWSQGRIRANTQHLVLDLHVIHSIGFGKMSDQ